MIRSFWKTFAKYRYLLEELVVKDFKLKYRRSILGVLWSILNPLLMMVIITVVFSKMFQGDIPNFPVYYLCGHLVFNFVMESTNGALTSIVQSGYLIKKVYVPKYIFPLEKCTFALVNTFFTVIALLMIVPITGGKLHWTILMIFIPILYSYLFSIGLGMFLATLNTFFRDIGYIYTLFSTIWMYLTPLFYPESMLHGISRTLVRLNPLYYYVNYVRELVLYGNIPSLKTNLMDFAIALISLVIGTFVFHKKQNRFILFI